MAEALRNHHKPVNWKTNLAALWVAQFLSLSAFSFSLPFMPLYIKESGMVPAAEVNAWAGFFISAASISMMIMSPIWGSLGDKYGRKMMLVRANLGGAFVLYLMGVVGNIEALIVLRVLQGAFTGTVPAAQTLVTTNTPDRNQGFAIGVLMAAVNAGTMAGVYFGGICAKYYGVSFSFKISGFMLAASTVLVLLMVRESFTRPLPTPLLSTQSARLRRRRETITNFMSGLPILVVIGIVAYIQTFDGPYLSLYIDDLFRQDPTTHASAMTAADITSHVYGLTGNVSFWASIASVLGSIIVGAFMDRDLPRWIWAVAAALSGAGAVTITIFPDIFGLTLGRMILLFFISGLASMLVVIMGRMTPPAKRGGAMGWSVTVRSVGWTLAPLSGAYVSSKVGFANAYLVVAILCFLTTPMFVYLSRRYRHAFKPMEEDKPSISHVGNANVNTPTGQGRLG